MPHNKPSTPLQGLENDQNPPESLEAQAERLIAEARAEIKETEKPTTSKLTAGLKDATTSSDSFNNNQNINIANNLNKEADKMAQQQEIDLHDSPKEILTKEQLDDQFKLIQKSYANGVISGEALNQYEKLLENVYGPDEDKYREKIAKIKAEYKKHVKEGENPTIELSAKDKNLAKEKVAREKYGIKEEDIAVNFDELDSERNEIAKNNKQKDYFDDGGKITGNLKSKTEYALNGKEMPINLSKKAIAIQKYGENLIKNHITDPDKISKFFYAFNNLPANEQDKINASDKLEDRMVQLDIESSDSDQEMIASK